MERGKERSENGALGISKAYRLGRRWRGVVRKVQETNEQSTVPEAREEIIPEGEQSTLLTAAGLNKMNY